MVSTFARKRMSGESDWALQRTRNFLASLKATRNVGTVGALDFPGLDEKFNLATDLLPGTQDFFLIFAINPDTTDPAPVFVNGATVDGREGFLVNVTNARVQLAINDSVQSSRTVGYISDVNSVPTGSWSFVVVCVDRDGDAYSYVNGVLQSSTLDVSGQQSAISNSFYGVGTIGDYSTVTLDGQLSRYGYGEGSLPSATNAVSFFNLGNGKFAAEMSPTEQAMFTYFWNMNDGANNTLTSQIGSNDGSKLGTGNITPVAGPRQATAADMYAGYPGVLTSFADTVTCWKGDRGKTPDGSYRSLKLDKIGGYNAQMTGFNDVDAAHVASPHGQWGPWIENAGSQGATLDGWMLGTLNDGRSGNTPSANFVGGSTKLYDDKESYDLALEGYTESPRSTDIPSQLIGVKSISCSDATNEYATAGAPTISGQGARTFAFFMKVDLAAAAGYIYAEGAYSPTSVGMFAYWGGTSMTIGIATAAGYLGSALFNTATLTPYDGQWVCVVVTFDGTTDADSFIAYLEGAEHSSTTAAFTTQGGASAYNAMFFGRNDGTVGWEGSLCLPAITAGRAWTPTEVTAYYTDGTIPSDATSVWRGTEQDTCQLDVDFSLLGNNSDRCIQIADDSSMDGSGTMTVEAWLFHSTGNDYVLAKRTSTGSGWGLYASSSHQLVFYHGDSANAISSSTGVIPVGEWVHVAATWDGTDGHFFLNGTEVPVAGGSNAEIASPNSLPVYVGARDDGSGSPTTFMGTSAKVAKSSFYDSELTTSEIQALAQGIGTGAPVASFTFDATINLAYLINPKAIRGDGTAAYLDCGDPNEGLDPITVTGWFRRFGAPSSSEYMISRYETGANERGWGIRVTATTGVLQTYYSIDGTTAVNGGNSSFDVCDGQWHHVAWVFDYAGSGNAYLYFDGRLIDTTALSADVHDSSANVTIFSTLSSGSPSAVFAGDLADMRLYAAALTQAQIRQLIAGTDYTTGLAAEWGFDEEPRSILSCAGGTSLEFDGTGYVDCDDVLASGLSDLCLGAWIKTATVDAELRGILTKGTGSSGGIQCLRVENGYAKLVFQAAGGTAKAVTSDTLVADGSWHHVWGSIDRDGSLHLHVDGTEEGTPSSIAVDSTKDSDMGGASWLIGDYQNITSGEPFIGLIDDARCLYGSLYSDADIAVLAAGNEPATSPTSLWPLDDGPQDINGQVSLGDTVATWTTNLGETVSFYQDDPTLRPIVEEDSNGVQIIQFNAAAYLESAIAMLTQQAGGIQIAFTPTDNSTYAWFGQFSKGATDYGYLRSNGDAVEMVTNDGASSVLAHPDTITAGSDVIVMSVFSDGSATFMKWQTGDYESPTVVSGANDGEWFGDMTGLVATIIGAANTGSYSIEPDGDLYEVDLWNGPVKSSDMSIQAARMVSAYA